jgi:hypothetical protein
VDLTSIIVQPPDVNVSFRDFLSEQRHVGQLATDGHPVSTQNTELHRRRELSTASEQNVNQLNAVHILVTGIFLRTTAK